MTNGENVSNEDKPAIRPNVTRVPLAETPMALELGEMFALPTESIVGLIKHQIITVPKGEPPATDAELALVLSIMRKHKLDPTLKQCHAWRDNRGKMVTMVGYDGWVDYANRQPTFQRVSYKYGERKPSPDGKGCKCWEWVEVTVHDSIRGEMVMPPVYLEEWYVTSKYPGPWQTKTSHKLRVKAYSLAIREAYGFGGLEVGEREDIAQTQAYYPAQATAASIDDMASALRQIEAGDDPATCGLDGCTESDVSTCGVCGLTRCEDHFSDSGVCVRCDDRNDAES